MNELFSISYMGCHHSYWLSYFSRWLKPPTSRCCFPCKNDKTCCEVTFSHVSEANLFKSWVSLNHTQIGIWRKHVSRGERTKREDQVNWNCCTVICPVASCHSFEYVVFTFCSQLEGFAGIGLEKRPESLNFSETSCFFLTEMHCAIQIWDNTLCVSVFFYIPR